MLNVTYAESHLCCVTYKLFMLRVIMLNVIMLSVVMLSVVALYLFSICRLNTVIETYDRHFFL